MRNKTAGAARAFLVLAALILTLVLSPANSFALTYYGYTEKNLYEKNTLINYTAYADVNLSANVSVSLINMTTGTVYNYTNVSATQNYFTASLNASVTNSGEYVIRSEFAYNGTRYINDMIVKISGASHFSIFADRVSYSPGEAINFTVKAQDSSKLDVPDEFVAVKLSYMNYTPITQTSGATSGAGEFSSSLTAPSSSGNYILSANDWLAYTTIAVGGFDMISYSGDITGSVKYKYGLNEDGYIYVDLLTSNKTKYSGALETISMNITYPSGASNATSATYQGAKWNYSLRLNESGSYSVNASVVSNALGITKYMSFNFSAAIYEIKTSVKNSRGTNIFFPNETVPISAKVYNSSSGEIMSSNFSGGWSLELLNYNGSIAMNISNSTGRGSDNSYSFSFLANMTPGNYYVRIRLNQSETSDDVIMQDHDAQAMPVDQDYQFKNIFIPGKNNARILTTLMNASGDMNVTGISVLSIKKSGSGNIKNRLSINTSLVDYKLSRAGLVEFAPPVDAGWYYAKMLVNNRYIAETWFSVKVYATCSQLSGYKWFVGSGEDASLQVTVYAAQETGFMESIGGKDGTQGSQATGGGSSFGSMYGMPSCSGGGNSTGGNSTSGNVSANVQVTVAKITNVLTSEDYTKKLSSLPTGTTNSNGNVTLNITKPSGGWSGGSYIVELDLKDNNNNTDKGFASFNVKSFWINVWPQQTSGYWIWYFGPRQNFTFNVYSYNSTNTWGSYNSWYNSGVGDNCSVANVYYQGSGGEWFWPPKQIEASKYNSTCAGSQGKFNLTVVPNSAFKSGSYMVRVRVNTSTDADVGDGWFSVKIYNVYLKSNTSNYYDSWYIGSGSNASFRFEITYANNTDWSCGWDPSRACANRVNETLNVTITKVLRSDNWMPAEYAGWKYNASVINGTGVVSYGSMNITAGNGTIVLIPKGGTGNSSWESGYYNVIVDVTGSEGTETGYAWFESRPFFVEATPVNNSAGYPSKWRYKSTDTITLNVSAASKPSWMKYYSSYSGASYQYSDANITSISLSRYDYSTWRMQNVSVTNYTPSIISGVTVVNITPASLQPGSYNLEITLRDNQSNVGKGYAWFEVRDFTLSAQTANWKWKFNNSENITLAVMACDADTWWCSGSGLTGVAVNVTKVQRTGTWPYTDVAGWASNSSNTTANGAGLNVYRASGSWDSGYYTAEVTGTYNNITQTANVWFEIESFSMNVWANKWEYTMRENVSLSVQLGKDVTISNVSVNCGNWPSYQTYSYASGTLNVSPTSLSSGTSNITFIPSSGKWPSGYCNGQITASAGGETKTQWFSFNVQPVRVSVNNYNSKYNFLKNESVLLAVNPQQAINFTMNMTLWPYDGGSSSGIVYAQNLNFTVNATNISRINADSILNITPNGTWRYGSYSGQMTVYASDDASSFSTVWFNFYVQPPYSLWISPYYVNKSVRSQNFTAYVYSNTGANATSLNITLLAIKYWPSSCYYNCNYQFDTDWNATNATTNSNGQAMINITRGSDWSSTYNYLTFAITDASETVNATYGISIN